MLPLWLKNSKHKLGLIPFIRKYFTTPRKHHLSFRQVLNYRPKHFGLFQLAVTHKSADPFSANQPMNNERLEYLGDAILNAVIAEHLYHNYPGRQEGFLTKMRAKIVSRDTLNDIARQMGLNRLMICRLEEQPGSNLLGNACSMAEIMALSPEDTLCIPVPFFHCFGCVIGTMCSVVSGTTMAPVTSFSAPKVLETVESLQCTALHGVPTMFIAELEEMGKHSYDTSHLRTGVMAGSTCPVEVMRGVIDTMGAGEMTIVYGQTESSPGITQTRRHDSLQVRTETVGRALPHVEVTIADSNTGKELPPGETGELITRGYHVMKGYYKMPEKTREVIDDDGWLYTGDLAVMDEEGNFRIVGRLKDMIIRGGENIYPREIEEFLYTHPKIKDAQVVGVPSQKYGEEVAAFIQLREDGDTDEEEIRDFCRGQIAYYKIPQYIDFVEEFPTTASGKVQKYKLREQFEAWKLQ